MGILKDHSFLFWLYTISEKLCGVRRLCMKTFRA